MKVVATHKVVQKFQIQMTSSNESSRGFFIVASKQQRG
jgi:hypothetical protein